MKKNSVLVFLIGLGIQVGAVAQTTDSTALQLIFPQQAGWNEVKEGTPLQFQVKAIGGEDAQYRFSIASGKVDGITFDTLGNFSWTPSYDLVERLQESKEVEMLFEVKDGDEETATQPVVFKVINVNRSPVVT